MSDPYPTYPFARPPRERGPNPLAVAAFVLALIPLGVTWLVAIGLAIPAMRRARRAPAKGEGLAIAALVISIVMLTLTAMVVAIVLLARWADVVSPDRDEDGRVLESTVIDMTELRDGDCFGVGEEYLFDDRNRYRFTVLPCDEAHRYEVFAQVEVSGDFPGESALEERATVACADRFGELAGEDYVETSLDYGYLHPSKGSWREGDRRILCVAFDLSENLVTGSFSEVEQAGTRA